MSYRVNEKQVIYSGTKVRLELHHLQNEETGARHTREVCVHPGAVAILGVLDDERILLIRNFRHAIGQYLVEVPAGTLEKGEDPINCAGRELLEETGYLAKRLKSIGVIYTSPGILSEKMYLYAAYDLQLSKAAPEEGEDIEVMPVTWAAAEEMIAHGQIQDGKTIAALLMYEKFYRGGRS